MKLSRVSDIHDGAAVSSANVLEAQTCTLCFNTFTEVVCLCVVKHIEPACANTVFNLCRGCIRKLHTTFCANGEVDVAY